MLSGPVMGLTGLGPGYGGVWRGMRPRLELEVVARRLGELRGLTFAVPGLNIVLVVLGHGECLFSQSGG